MAAPFAAPAPVKYARFACPNPDCPRFGELSGGNIRHRSWTGKRKDIERLRCADCGVEFSERRGTLLSHSKLAESVVVLLLKCQRWGVCDEGTADICDVDLKTVHRFQNVAADRARRHHDQAVREVEVAGVQMDEAHSKLRPRRSDWIHTALAMGSAFLLWVEFGPRQQQCAAKLIAQVVARVKGIPMFFTDGWKAYPGALLQVLGRRYQRRRRGNRGRHPKPVLAPPSGLFYAQVVKVRDATGNLVEVTQKVVFGGPRRFLAEMKRRGLGSTIQTAFMERWYATLRGLCAPFRRRTRCLSWVAERHRGRVWLLVDLYNFVIPHRSLRKDRQPCTPAVAAGLAASPWTYHDYVWQPVHPDPAAEEAMQQRVGTLLVSALEAT